ncbi:hypothetical protein AK88_05094 [Plasmodium fragile]|uniref:Uncharacterized protein n=1 Tax=Plasmodium fragile TaxID=5857 RepID=A0A0D9QE54_PLAFR|nr:uncharacterized protein AK88_05094 [Plasmodium fragile]KJP85283.1 hypothetical protein AK88_05094 [Plasmodium fragile]
MKIIEPSNCNVSTINHLPNGRTTLEPVKEQESSDRKGEQHVARRKSLHVKVSRAQSEGETETLPHSAPPERNTHTDEENEKDKNKPLTEEGRIKRIDNVPGDESIPVPHLKKIYTLTEGGDSTVQHSGGLTELEEDSFVGDLSSENSSALCDKARTTNCSFGEDKLSTQQTPPMGDANKGHVDTEKRQPEDYHPRRDTPRDGYNNGDGEEGDKRASIPTDEATPKNEIEQLKEEIKKEVYNRLTIALDINMNLNENEKYYDLFKKKKKFQKYIMNSCKFVIILGKHLKLSFSTISIALYYLHKYYEKILKRKKNALPYLIGGACIFLAWKMREDMENLKRSKKLYDIPKMIFKLLNYFDKKKKIKKKMKELQVRMFLSGCADRKWEDLSDEHTVPSTAGNAAKGEGDARPPGEESQRDNPPQKGKKKRKLSPKEDEKRSSTESTDRSSLHRDLAQIKRIINTGYVSDVNNISHASDCFNSYLSECNSRDVSEYEFEGEEGDLHDDIRDGLHDGPHDYAREDAREDPEEPPAQTYLTQFQHLCKREKRKIHISASKWVLNNSGQKLQLMQKVIIYYEGEILKSINYFLKPDKCSFHLLPSFVGAFVNIMNGYVSQDEVGSLQKIASLSILDYFKTPLCLVFTSNEIMVASILRAYISLKWICGQLDVQTMSLQDFEKKATRFTQYVSSKNPISITRVKIALREIRLFGE